MFCSLLPFQHRSAHGLSCSRPSSPPRPAGQLLLLLQHQAAAGRVKVLLRKAEALGRLSHVPGTPGRARGAGRVQVGTGNGFPSFCFSYSLSNFFLPSTGEGWNEMNFGVPSNPKHSVIL